MINRRVFFTFLAAWLYISTIFDIKIDQICSISRIIDQMPIVVRLVLLFRSNFGERVKQSRHIVSLLSSSSSERIKYSAKKMLRLHEPN